MDQASARQEAISEESSDIEKERLAAQEQAKSSQSEYSQAISVLSDLDAKRDTLESQRR